MESIIPTSAPRCLSLQCHGTFHPDLQSVFPCNHSRRGQSFPQIPLGRTPAPDRTNPKPTSPSHSCTRHFSVGDITTVLLTTTPHRSAQSDAKLPSTTNLDHARHGTSVHETDSALAQPSTTTAATQSSIPPPMLSALATPPSSTTTT